MRDIIKKSKGFVLVIIHINHAQPLLGSPQPQNKIKLLTHHHYEQSKIKEENIMVLNCKENKQQSPILSISIVILKLIKH